MAKYGWLERVLVWALTLAFLAAAAGKIFQVPDIVDVFTRFGLPEWFMYLTAAVEITGALGLHFRQNLLGLAAPAMLMGTMIVGAGFHMVYDTPPEAIPALVLATLSAIILFLRRPRAATVTG